MEIAFINNDHEKIQIIIAEGSSIHNFGLSKNESHRLDMNFPYTIAWHSKNDPISNQEFSLFGYTSIGDVRWDFGSPPGRVT